MTEPITIRAATHDDIEPVLRLWKEAGLEPSPTDTTIGVERLLSNDPASLLLAIDDARVVGSVIAAFDGWRGNLYHLGVHPEWRRRGIAERLVEAAEDHLRALGAERVTALVLAQREPAVALWRTVGYEPDLRVQRSVKNLGSNGNA